MRKPGIVLLITLFIIQAGQTQGLPGKERELQLRFDKATSDTARFNAGLDFFQYYRNQDSAKTMLWYRTLSTLVKNKGSEARLLNAYGSFLVLYGKMDSADIILNKAITISEQLKLDNVTAAALNNLAVASFQLAENKKALGYNLRALKIRERLNDEEGIEASLMNIGNVYWNINSIDTALSYFKRALAYAVRLNLPNEIAKAYNNMASVYFDKDEFDTSYHLMRKSLFYREKSNNLTGKCLTLTALGDVCSILKRFKEATTYYDTAYALSRQLGDDMNMTNILNSLGHMEQGRKNYNKAIEYQLKSLALSRSIPYPQMEKDALIELAESYERSARPVQALSYYKLYMTAKDSISHQSNEVEIAEMQTRYETEKKEQRITLLSKENTIQKLTISRRNNTIALTAGLLLAVLAFAWLFYNRYKLKQSARLQEELIRQQDQSVKAILEAEEKERTRIAGELHDGIGQMFSTVKMNLSGLEGYAKFQDPLAETNFKKTLALVDESCKEVRNLSHQMAPVLLLTYGFVPAIKDFLGKIDQRLLKTTLTTDGTIERMNTNTETILYRIIQEAVNNVIKHANATRLDIQLIREKDGLSVMVEDDGQGFKYSREDTHSGMGFKGIQSRLNILKGTLDIDAAPGRGTVISLWIPLP